MSAAHQLDRTPGPWFADRSQVVDADGGWIADCSGANAPMVAASADLFAALIRARSYVGYTPESPAKVALLGIIDAALAKARA